MNLLFDFITLQDTFINGGAGYTLEVLNKILESKKCAVLALLSKKLSVPEFLRKIIEKEKIPCFYIQDGIEKIISENKIDRFYIGISQRYNSYDLSKIQCKIIMTCHDVGDLSQLYDGSIYSARRSEFVRECEMARRPTRSFLKKVYRAARKNYRKFFPIDFVGLYKNFSSLVKNKNVYVFTVSEYSKYALLYFFDGFANEIKYFYAPQKTAGRSEKIENPALKNLVESGKKYFLLVSCDRANKNAALFADVWNKFLQVSGGDFYAVLCGKIKYSGKNIVQIDSLSASDLENAYKNAYALVYPSVSEGFGYPPVEAMKYGTPCLCSNATSIPEICGSGALYFNARYPEDLFRAMIKLSSERNEYSKKSAERFKAVSERQKSDFCKIAGYILEC